jgi:Transcriptional regulator, AbiEi antitoxin
VTNDTQRQQSALAAAPQLELFRKNLGTRDAIRLGDTPETLYSLGDSGEIEQIGRGLYLRASAPLANPAAGARIPQAVAEVEACPDVETADIKLIETLGPTIM